MREVGVSFRGFCMKVNIKSRCVVNWGNVSRSVLKIKIRPLADSKQATKRKSPVWTGIQTGRGGRLLALPRERQMDSYHGAFGGTLMALTIYPECVLPPTCHINVPPVPPCPLPSSLSLAGDLAHVVRVTTLGELTASIAHEVNQPRAAVVAN